MIRLKHGKIKFELCQSWAELTVCQWNKIKKAKTNREIVTSCTNKIEDVDSIFTDEFIEGLLPYLVWLMVPIDTSGWVISEEAKIDIKKQEFGKIILLRNANESDDRIKNAINIYYDVNVNNLSLYDAIAMANDLYLQLDAINKMEASKLKFSPTPEQRRAGIEKFNRFGINNTIDSLAGGDVLKYEQILKIDYNTIFMKMWRSKVEGEFQRNYSKIMSEKK